LGGLEIFPPLYIYIKIKVMKIEKKIIKEAVGDNSKGPKTFSDKKQNIIITEKQLEKILEKLQK
jgi:hypothetical protein